MQNQSLFKNTYYYRPYNLPLSFPSVAFIGDNWILPDTPLEYMHFHNCIEIGHCLSGEGTIYVENKEYTFKPNDICIISENTIHISKSASQQKSKWEYIYFNPYLLFGDRFPSSLFNNLFFSPPYFSNVLDSEAHPYIHFLVTRMFSEYHEKKANYQYSLRGLFLTFIIVMTRTISYNISESDAIAHIRSSLIYIHEHYTQKIQIKDISVICNLSEPHFRRKFVEVMHISPLDYINRLRIRKSCREIYRGEKALNEIALEVGFTSLSSFNRQFHSLLGCSPSDWRKKIRLSEDYHEITSLEDDSTKEIFDL